MPPHQRCQECGRPCVGRFCWEHLCRVLDRMADLRRCSPEVWVAQVNEANRQAEEKRKHAVSTPGCE